MRVRYLLSVVMLLLVFAHTPAHAEVYFSEDFEAYDDGVDIGEESDVWEMTEPNDNPIGAGIASSNQALSGQKSALFDDARCMGFPFAVLGLPESYVVSTWFYHDPDQDPPPDAIVTMIPDAYPGGGGSWLGIGTRNQAVVPENYTFRDKTGTGIYEDTGIPRRAEWVQFVFVVNSDATNLYVDGKEIYTANIASSRYNGYQMSRTPPWGAQNGEVFIDDVMIADTMEEIAAAQSVSAAGKLISTWGGLKR